MKTARFDRIGWPFRALDTQFVRTVAISAHWRSAMDEDFGTGYQKMLIVRATKTAWLVSCEPKIPELSDSDALPEDRKNQNQNYRGQFGQAAIEIIQCDIAGKRSSGSRARR